jgi:hypothetical protein
VIRNPKKVHFQAKVLARKNASHPLKIHAELSDDDSDFVQPPPKRNRGPEQEPCNIPGPDREAPLKKAQKVM